MDGVKECERERERREKAAREKQGEEEVWRVRKNPSPCTLHPASIARPNLRKRLKIIDAGNKIY
jgi:hypothetical protein